MRILHTSDWHLGASLEEMSREADHRQFLAWLHGFLISESVDALIIAGDIFDTATPSAEAQALYYRFLHDLGDTPLRQVIVVGGNHDSAARLDAPKELLSTLGVHVVGGVEGANARLLCPLKDSKGVIQAIVAAVPFANEWRLGYRGSEGSLEDRQKALGSPFKAFYRELADQAQADYPGIPLIATGHLAIAGSEKDDAPQEIHLMGTLGGLPKGIFDERYQYVALGHIHRHYQVGGTNAWYSGSPIALNIKEGLSPRKVNILDIEEGGKIHVQPFVIPQTRQVIQLQGPFEKVKSQLLSLSWTEPLPPMVKLVLHVDRYEVGLEELCREWVSQMDPAPQLIGISQKQTLPLGSAIEGLALDQPSLMDLEPRDVFRMLCEARQESFDELKDAFESLLVEEVQA